MQHQHKQIAEAMRRYTPTYVQGQGCPGCGHKAMNKGRSTAECGRCGTAVPLAYGRIG